MGPVGGVAKGISTIDVAFASSAKQVKVQEPEPDPVLGSLPSFQDEELPLAPEGGGGLGRWIVAGSLVVILGAAFVVYFFVFRGADERAAKAAPDGATALTGTTRDGGVPEPSIATVTADTVVEDAWNAILADDSSALVSIQPRLAGISDSDPAILALRSRVEATLAQELLDRVEVNAESAPDEARELEREAKNHVAAAMREAKAAIEADGEAATAQVAMADALRLQGEKAREVKRWLQKAGEGREGKLVEALLEIRENKLRRARALLASLDADDALEKTGDVRPRYRLALIDFESKDYEKARDAADAVLAVQPGHTRAAVLLERIRAATLVVDTDPMPPEVDSSGTGGRGESYESLLERANKKAEVGQCSAAMSIYERALNINPSGVAALTGLGYCHLDAAEFASAQAKFRAALGISPRYQEALLGVAEAYQQQGLKDKAIAAYQRFLEEHPTSPRAEQARRQIERLGGSADSGGFVDTGDTASGDTSGGDTAGGDTGDTTGGDTEGDTEGAGTGGGTEGDTRDTREEPGSPVEPADSEPAGAAELGDAHDSRASAPAIDEP